MTNELEIHGGLATSEWFQANVQDAIDLASDQDQMTWLVSNGKRIAAIVPVDQAEIIMSEAEIRSAAASALETAAQAIASTASIRRKETRIT